MKETLVYVVRHGTTALNSSGCFRGNKDVPLDDSGIRDAHKLAFYFAPIDLACIVYSSRKRSTQTAEIIAQQKDDIQCYATDSLWAWDIGDFSGKPRSDENIDLLEHYINNPEEPTPNGESLNDFKRRIRPCVYEACEYAAECGKPLLLVVHSSVIHEVGDMLHSDHTCMLVEPGGVVEIYREDGNLKSEPIFKKLKATGRADTVS